MRRVASAFVLSSFLALGPTAAWAANYPAPEVAVAVDLPGTVATVGVPFNVWIPAADGAEVVLTIDDGTDSDERPPVEIAGVHTYTKIASNGGASFNVTIAAAGSFTILGHVDGVMVLAMAIGAEHSGAASADGGVAAATGTGDSGAQGGTDVAGGITAESGGVVTDTVSSSEAVFYGIGAALLVGAGTVLVVRARRRREPAL